MRLKFSFSDINVREVYRHVPCLNVVDCRSMSEFCPFRRQLYLLWCQIWYGHGYAVRMSVWNIQNGVGQGEIIILLIPQDCTMCSDH